VTLPEWWRISLVSGTVLVYALVFAPLYQLVGETAMVFTVVPAATIGWMFGWRAGLLAGLLSVPLNLLNLTLMGQFGWPSMLRTWPIMLINLAAGPVVGWARESRERIHSVSSKAGGERDQFFDLSLDLLCIAETNGYFKQVNRAWERTLNWSRDELCSQPFMDFVHPDDRQRTHAAMEQLCSGQPVINFENRYRHRDGSYRWLAWTCSALGREHPLLCGVARDITEQKQMEAAIHTSAERFRTIFENAGAGIEVRDVRGQLTECNSVWTEMIGYTKEEMSRMSFAAYTHPDDLASDQGLLQELMDGTRDFYHLEKRYIHKNGRVWWGHLSLSLIRDERGAPQFTVAMIKDMTSQKDAEAAYRRLSEELEQRIDERTQELLAANRALRSLESWQRTLIDTIQGIVWECSAKSWLFTFVSPQAEALLGYPVSQWLDQPEFWQTHTHPDDRQWVREYCVKMAWEKTKYAFEYRMMAADGRIVWLRDIVTVERDQNEPVILRGIMVDITDSKQAEAALAASEQKFRLLTEHAVDVIYQLDPSGQILYVSPASLKMFGYRPQEMVGTHFAAYLSTTERPKADQAFGQAIAGISISSVELSVTAKDGVQVPVEVNLAPIDEHGTITGVHGIIRDIRDRKRTEEELRRSWAFVDSVVDNLPAMIFVKDARELRFVRFNKAGEELLGYDRDNLLGQTDYTFFPKEEADFFTRMDRAVLESGRLLDIPEEPIQTKEKGVRVLHTKKIPIFDATGTPLYLLGISEDITERKRAEEALRESEARYQSLIEAIPQQVWTARPDGTLDYVNRRVLDYFNSQPDDLLGWKWQYVFHPDDPPACLETWSSALRTGEPYEIEFRLRRACDDAYRWHLVRAMPVKDASGQVLKWFGTNTDITEGKRTEQALRRIEEQLRKAMDDRQELAQDLHDNIIQTIYATGLILEECRHLLRKNHAHVDERLAQTIRYLNRVIVDVRHYIAWAVREEMTGDQLCTKLTELANHLEGVRGVRFSLNLATATAKRLPPAQAFHILYIVQEAVSNSLRHSQGQTGLISLQKVGERIRVEVKDDGVGFIGEDASRRGHGLQNMAMRAQKLGGTLRVVSHPGRGTHILVEFPQEAQDDSIGR